jgi:hypothetical protein
MKSKKLLALTLSAMLLASGHAWTQQAPPPPPAAAQDEEVQPRFIWGIIINFALSKIGGLVWNIFSSWLETKLTGGVDAAVNHVTASLFKNSGASVKPRSSTAVAARGAEVVVGTPDTALKAGDGKENYQGVHLALMLAQPDGKSFQFRAVNQGFKTGEKFRLRVVSTFGGEMTIENINPRGERRQIYPAKSEEVIALQPGKETLIPLGDEEYFAFTNTIGREQLVINIADPRAVGPAASRNKVYRQDVRYGSNFVQEVTPETYPFISQAIELTHAAQ